MKRWVVAGLAIAHAARRGIVEAVMDLAGEAISKVRSWIANAWNWHRQRLLTDPTYPVALLTIGKVIVRLTVPRAGLAAALVALLAEWLIGSQWLEEPDDWEDRY